MEDKPFVRSLKGICGVDPVLGLFCNDVSPVTNKISK